jgi:hypothetical protein
VILGNIDWVCSANTAAQDGNYSLDLLGSGNVGGVSQTFDTIPGAWYSVTFQLSGNPGPVGGNPAVKPLQVNADGFINNYTFDVTGHNGLSVAGMGWVQKSFPFMAAPGGQSTISFVTDLTGFVGFAGAQLDNVKVTLISTPALVGVYPINDFQAVLYGRIDGLPSTNITLDVFRDTTCAGVATINPRITTSGVNTDADGFFVTAPLPIALGQFAAVSMPSGGATRSNCMRASAGNDIWPRAFPLTTTNTVQDYIDIPGLARWYRFPVTPGQRIDVTLSGLPADYDVAVFKDIGQAFLGQLVATPVDITRLTAEYAPTVFSPTVFSPTVFSPTVFSPDAYSPTVFSPTVFSPTVFSPTVFSPTVFSPTVFSPTVFSPTVFSPTVFSPTVFSPTVFSPTVFSPTVFSPTEVTKAFSSAQTRSILAVSATPGTGDESAAVNTWNNTGEFYVRVSGRSGAFSPNLPFTLTVNKGPTSCAAVTDLALSSRAAQPGSGLKTIVLTDSTKVDLGAAVPGGGTLASRLATFIARPEVGGVVVDVSGDLRVGQLKTQAAANNACPFARNLLAQEIKTIVNSYRALNPLKYVVILGNDDAIPFFRYPDESLIGMESGYVPPVKSDSASEASLRNDFVLGQDAYGSSSELVLRSTAFPIPGLAVGRLVETPAEMAGMLDAYMTNSATTNNGVVVPTTSLVTGYDFLQDAADAVVYELGQGGAVPDTLITPNGKSPEDVASWTAADLRARLFYGPRYGAIFLAGHFSANSMLSADFESSILTSELVASPADLVNTIVFSAGCHSGYNLIDGDGIDGVTMKLDWAQAFAQKKATLIAGTGYQYGDTDFLEYSERIYSNFARQLRAGTGEVSVGEALMKAKQDYLAVTPDIRGLHQKALLQATLFGLPMLRVNMASGRSPAPCRIGRHHAGAGGDGSGRNARTQEVQPSDDRAGAHDEHEGDDRCHHERDRHRELAHAPRWHRDDQPGRAGAAAGEDRCHVDRFDRAARRRLPRRQLRRHQRDRAADRRADDRIARRATRRSSRRSSSR